MSVIPIPTVGETFRKRRLDVMFTQEKLAQAAGISTSMVQLVERGLPPSANVADRLERALTEAEAAKERLDRALAEVEARQS
jgi:transcriptional regulator with XRE-family HTH domain